MSRQRDRGVNNTKLRAHCRAVAQLPAGPWHISTRVRDNDNVDEDAEFAGVSKQTVMTLHRHGIIEPVGVIETKHRAEGVSIWQCRRQYRERAQEILAARDGPVGCGHTGLRNLRDGGFTCTDDDCDVEVSREVLD
jgi:hypothetical protein